MFHTVNTRLLGVIVSLSLSLVTLAGFLIYLLIVTRSNGSSSSHYNLSNANAKLSGLHNAIYSEGLSSSPPHHRLNHNHLHSGSSVLPSFISSSASTLSSSSSSSSSSSPSASSMFSNFAGSSATSPTSFYDESDLSKTSICSSACPEKTYKDYLCDVKFVMLVNITDLLETYETANGTVTRVYSISIKKTFKKSLLFIIAFRTQRITVTSIRGCSRDPLEQGHLYFVTGRVKGLTALVDHCDLTIDWTTVNESLKDEIRLFFSTVIGSCNNYANP